MSSGLAFWKRIGGAIRGGSSAPRNGFHNGNGHGGGAVGVVEDGVATTATDPDVSDAGGSSIFPWVRRQQMVRQMDQRYQRVIELMDAMRAHFEAQDRRAAELTAGITRVAGTLELLADVQRSQCDGIKDLSARVDVAAKYSGDLAAMLVEMPASLQAQAEAMHSVARQMEAARSSDSQLTDSLRQFGRAADSLHDSGRAQVESLQRLFTSSKDQEENMRGFVHSQTRLLVIITVIVAVLGLGAISALAVVVHMVFNGGVVKLG